jgi:dienelactone hydrolase
MPHPDQATRAKQKNEVTSRRRQLRRRRAVALLLVLCAAAVVIVPVGNLISAARSRPRPHLPRTETVTRSGRVEPRPLAGRAVPAGTYGVGVMTLHLVDDTRTITLPDGQVVPRQLRTVVYYPTLGTGAGQQGVGAPPAKVDGPFPLIVFGHGFDLMPGYYSRLLRYWTSAGFVVATPVFPRENPKAVGGLYEPDLVNQPQDMVFVISSLLHDNSSPQGTLSGLIRANRIAVAGHSDGGDTALALADDPSVPGPSVQAVVVLSGAEIPWLASFKIAPGGPPLLATQGTADKVNLPSATAAFYDPAPAPKFLLQLLGGTHLGPYRGNRVELAVVQKVTTAFLQYYLYRDPAAMTEMLADGRVAHVSTLLADP